jgi:hypothetical protein
VVLAVSVVINKFLPSSTVFRSSRQSEADLAVVAMARLEPSALAAAGAAAVEVQPSVVGVGVQIIQSPVPEEGVALAALQATTT